jgi:hypothetical protein
MDCPTWTVPAHPLLHDHARTLVGADGDGESGRRGDVCVNTIAKCPSRMPAMSESWDAFVAVQDASFATATAVTRASFPPESRLTAAELRDVLTGARHLVVATTRPDGRPHSAPSSFACYDGGFWLPAGAGTVRVRNIRSTPYAALVVMADATVTAEGPATLTTDPPAGVLTAYDRRVDWVSIWIHVRPERLFSYRNSA